MQVTGEQILLIFIIILVGAIGGLISDVFTNNIQAPKRDEKTGKLDLGTIRTVLIGATAAIAVWLLGQEKSFLVDVGAALISGLTGSAIIATYRKREGLEEKGIEAVKAIGEQAEEIDKLRHENRQLRALINLSDEEIEEITKPEEADEESSQSGGII